MKKNKRALVLEGGGIRSAYLAGVLECFQEHGFNRFDVVVGTSAGACCGTNFITGEAQKNRIILEEYLVGSRFVKYHNTFSSKNIVDIDFLIDEVCRHHVPLDLKRFNNSESILYIAATDFKTGEPHYFNNREDDIFEALRASCAMPYLYRKPVYINGRRYIDGGMSASIPLAKAIELGCNEIVVISTRERHYQKSASPAPKWLHDFFYPNSTMAELFALRHIQYNEIIKKIENPPAGVQISLVAPSRKLQVGRTTKSKIKVRKAIQQGYDDGLLFCESLAELSVA